MANDICLTVLIEDSVDAKANINKRLITKHGFSILIETKADDTKVCVLMDTGPSAEALLNNVDVMGVNLRQIDAIVLSHGHYDHTDGLIGVLKSINKPTMVIAHPKAFNPKFAIRKKLKFIGQSFTRDKMGNAGGFPLFATNPVEIAENITTTGEIERKTGYEKLRGSFTVEDEKFIADSMLDDQALIINLKDKGLVVVTGCAHAGIVNTVMQAQRIMKTNKIHAVLGGFHLIDATDKRIQLTIEDLKKFKPKLIGPCHCTGKKATRKLREAFGETCQPLQTGNVIKL